MRLLTMKVLVTGGAGYIGSTTAKALETAGHVPVVLDSLVTGPRAFVQGRLFYEGDIADRALVRRILHEHPDIACTVHMAARVVVPESVAQPLLYYRENVSKTVTLVEELVGAGHGRVLFSSSAALYDTVEGYEVDETSPLRPTSPYARSKLMVEQVLQDAAGAGELSAILLRYFNPIGSDPSLESGVHARHATHVLGQIVMAALGQQESFTLTGTDLPTRDGTGIRDYVHVWDIARAHVAAVSSFDAALAAAGAASTVINLGTGRGVTVRELLGIVEETVGHPVPTVEGPSRPGDTVGAYANVDKARELLGWASELSVVDGVDSALRWARRRRHVLGYD
jgi:UDP-glucose 4-epimerase